MTEQAALKCLYLAIMSLDPTGRAAERWINRWKAVLSAFHITFDGRLSAGGSRTDKVSYTEDLIDLYPFARDIAPAANTVEYGCQLVDSRQVAAKTTCDRLGYCVVVASVRDGPGRADPPIRSGILLRAGRRGAAPLRQMRLDDYLQRYGGRHRCASWCSAPE